MPLLEFDEIRGISITEVVVNSDGELVITMSDGEVKNLGSIQGEQGETGSQGDTGVDGREVKLYRQPGDDVIYWGYDNDNPEKWMSLFEISELGGSGSGSFDGVTDVTLDDQNNLIISYSNGTSQSLGHISGQPGTDGQDGVNGTTFTPNVDDNGDLS